MRLEEYEENMSREVRGFLITILVSVMAAVVIIAIILALQKIFPEEETLEPLIETPVRGHPTEIEEFFAEPPEAHCAWISNDTPKRDSNDDNFELLANCVYAEAGNQSEYGIRLVCDVILNRAGGKISKVDDVITAPNQFSSYSDGGMDRWCDIPENIYRICAEEVRSRTDTKVWFFRTGRFSDYGTPWTKIGDHFFSWR